MSVLYLPLYSNKGIIGVVTVQSLERDAYSEYIVSLMRNLGVSIGIALDNATLYENLEEKVAERTQEVTKQKEEIEKITYGGTDKPREWVIRIQVLDTGNKDFKMLQISAGEEINKQPQYYATVETVYAVGK